MSLKRLSDGFAYTNIGNFRDQVTILQPSDDSLPDGSPDTPTVFANGVWAYIRRAKSPEEVNGTNLAQAEVWYEVRICYIAGVTTQMSVIAPSGETWSIWGVVDPDQRQRELWLQCRSINDAGDTTEVTEIVQGGQF